MSTITRKTTASFDPIGGARGNRPEQAGAAAAQRQAPSAAKQPDIARTPSPATGSAPGSGDRADPGTSPPGTSRATRSVTEGAGYQRANAKLDSAEKILHTVANKFPPASNAVKQALAQQFNGNPRYASFEQAHGPDWVKNLQIDTAERHELDLPGDEYIVTYTAPATGEAGAPAELNDRETRADLGQSFKSNVTTNYRTEQEAFWSRRVGGETVLEQTKAAQRDALAAEASLRFKSGTLSPQAYLATRDVVETPAAPASDPSAPVVTGSDISRVTVDGKDVPGAFVFTQHAADTQQGAAVLWRPGRPLQEFADTQALRTWVAGEKSTSTTGPSAAEIEAVGTPPVTGDVFDLRVQDLRKRNEEALAETLDGQSDSSIESDLDSRTNPRAYLDLSRARDGANTEGLRNGLSGPTAPAQMLQLENARQRSRDSGMRLAQESANVPSLQDFARTKITEQVAEDHPGAAAVDPDRTIVQTKVVKLEQGPHAPLGKTTVVGTKDYTLTEYALRNTSVWEAPESSGAGGMPVSSMTREKASATLVGENGVALVGQDGEPIQLDDEAVTAMAKKLDVGKHYTDRLYDDVSPDSGSAQQQRLQNAWMTATADKMRADRIESGLNPAAKATFKRQSPDTPGVPRGLAYADAVIDHPDPSTRPDVDGHRIVANSLVLGAANDKGGGGQSIRGVVVIGSLQARASTAVVLYTPDAPDNIAFRELSDIGEVGGMARDPAWKSYFTDRMATSDRAEADRILSGRGSQAGRTVIKPIQGDFYQDMYKSAAGFQISHAQHRSATNDQVSALSTLNKSLFAYDVATSLIPGAAGKGGQAASAARRAMAGLARGVRPTASGPGRLPIGGSSARAGGLTNNAPPSWSMNDPAVTQRLTPGNRGAGGIQYQRDPTTGKEYVNIDGNYYRGETRNGQNVIFNDRNISETRGIRSGPDGLSITPRESGLLGGNKPGKKAGPSKAGKNRPGASGNAQPGASQPATPWKVDYRKFNADNLPADARRNWDTFVQGLSEGKHPKVAAEAFDSQYKALKGGSITQFQIRLSGSERATFMLASKNKQPGGSIEVTGLGGHT